MAEITTGTIEFLSADGKTTIHACSWLPEAEPRGIVQLVHGMAEHIGRYDEFARFLAGRGFAVYGHDHLGHGKSILGPDELGHMPIENGKEILIKDVHTLRTLATTQLGETLPYFVFGHSMGSFVVRAYLARPFSKGLSGAVICGTGNVAPAASKAGNALCHTLGKLCGQHYRSKLVDGMGVGAYNKGIKNPRTKLDWLSYNTDNVDAYIADPLAGFMFTVGGYAAVTSLTAEVVKPECVAAYDKSLPLLFVAGADDPVGDCSVGVRAAAKLAIESGDVIDVSVCLYDGMRHEILNETDKARVMDDIAGWIEARL